MKISVLVPIYGVEQYIEQSLRSLFNQTMTDDVEFILVNDCTKDNSMHIVHSLLLEYSNLNIRIIEHNENSGLAASRQTAFDVALGEYVICYDSDDWCESNMLTELYTLAIEKGADIVSCDFIDSYYRREEYNVQKISENNYETVKMMLDGRIMGSLWNKLIKRSLFTQNNIRWITGVDMLEDLLMTVRLFYFAKSIEYLPKAFIHYRQNENSISRKLSDRHLAGLITFNKVIKLFFLDNNCYNIFSDSFELRRISILSLLIKNSTYSYQKMYINTFGLIHSNNIMSSILLRRYDAIALLCAVKGCLPISNFIYKSVIVFKRILR